MTKQFGLIGYPLSHSFSPTYFNTKFELNGIDAHYDTYPLEDIKDFIPLIQNNKFAGLNVTIPYKESIIPLLDEIEEGAKIIGAINTITFDNDKMIGYNTDVFGFEKSLMDFIESPKNITKAFILGTGGAAKAVKFVLDKLHIPYQMVSRKNGDITYEGLTAQIFSEVNLIINTTPLGMAPNHNSKPQIPYQWLNKKYFLYDLVYNPEKTIFLSEGLKKGCKIKNGHDMLILQAEKAWQIWNQI